MDELDRQISNWPCLKIVLTTGSVLFSIPTANFLQAWLEADLILFGSFVTQVQVPYELVGLPSSSIFSIQELPSPDVKK